MWLLDRPIAHRGLHDKDTPENTLSAFQKAIDKNYYIEIDVRLLADGEVVVFHDKTLERIIGKDVEIKNLTTADIKGKDYLLPNGENIPLLKEVLDFVGDKTKLLIELKTISFFKNSLEEKVYPMIKGKEKFIAIQSFSPPIVKWFAKNAPEFYCGALSTYVRFKPFNRPILWLTNKMLRTCKLDFLSFNILRLPSRAVSKIIDKNDIKFLGWTIKSEADIKLAQDCRIDNIIFEKMELKNGEYQISN